MKALLSLLLSLLTAAQGHDFSFSAVTESLELASDRGRSARREDSERAAWTAASADFDGGAGLRDAVRGPSLKGGTRIVSGRPAVRWPHTTVPPVPQAAPVRPALYAAEEKKDKKKEEKPPADPNAVKGAVIGMALGALIGFLLGGPIGACLGIILGALAGAALGKAFGRMSGADDAKPTP